MSEPMHFDEAVASGPLRLELRGNPDTARAHVRAGRKLLGQLRSIYGVNERIAAGYPGGYYTKLATLPDGSTIEAITNNGADTLRITTARTLSSSAQSTTLHGGETAGTLTAPTASFTPTRDAPELPGDPVSTREEEVVIEELPTADFAPYLWAGARFIEPLRVIHAAGDGEGGGDDLTAEDGIELHLCLWLPPAHDGEDPLILSNRRHLLGSSDVANLASYPLQNPANSLINDGEDPTYGAAYTGAPAYTPGGPLRAVQFSRAYQHLADGADLYAPDDIEPALEWPEVVIVDPDDDLDLGLDSGPPGGTYYLKLMAYYADCAPIAPFDVELRVIVGKGEGAIERSITVTLGETTAYLMAALPLGWHSTAFDDQLGRTGEHQPPLGRRLCSENILDDGDNPHAPHWWQGGFEIELPEQQDAVPASELQEPLIWLYDESDPEADVAAKLVPDYGFVPANFPDKEALCAYCTVQTFSCTFNMTYGVSVYWIYVGEGEGGVLISFTFPIQYVLPWAHLDFSIAGGRVNPTQTEADLDAELAAKGLAKEAAFHAVNPALAPVTRHSADWYGVVILDNQQAYASAPFTGPFLWTPPEDTFILNPGAGGTLDISYELTPSPTLFRASAEQTTYYDAAGTATVTPWAWLP